MKVKIKMLCRHTAPSGRKLDQGLIFEFSPAYAQELIQHGLAVLVAEPPAPGFVPAARPGRSKTGRFLPRGSKP